jgi:hypothetical protein
LVVVWVDGRLAGDLPVHFTWSKAEGWGVRKGTVGKMMQQAKRYLQEVRVYVCV